MSSLSNSKNTVNIDEINKYPMSTSKKTVSLDEISKSPIATSKIPKDEVPNIPKNKMALDVGTIVNYVSKAELWIFLVIAIIVLILCFVVASPNLEWYSNLRKVDWAENFWIIGIILIFTVLILTYVTFLTYIYSSENYKFVVIALFIGVMLLLFSWFLVFFSSKCLINAFYTSLILLFFTIMLTYITWSVDYRFGICTLPFLVFVIFIFGMSWHINDCNCEELKREFHEKEL